MPRIKAAVRAQMRALVVEAMIRHYDTEQAIEFVNRKLSTDPATGAVKPGRPLLKPALYFQIKSEILHDDEALKVELQRGGYLQQFLQLMDDTRSHISRLWALYDRVAAEVKKPALQAVMQQRLIMDINELTMRLARLQDALPFVAAVQARLKSDLEKVEERQKKVESQILSYGKTDNSEEEILKEIVDKGLEDEQQDLEESS